MPHATKRTLTAVVAAALTATERIQGVEDLARATGVSVRSLQRRCASSGLSAKAAADFVMCAQVPLRTDKEWDLEALFPELDPRTSKRLAHRAGFIGRAKPSLAEFLGRQRFVDQRKLRGEPLLRLPNKNDG